jgi:hypothetical protein
MSVMVTPMKARARRWFIAVLLGCTPVAVAARELHSVNPSTFTRTVLAPVPLFVGLVPTHNIGTPEEPLYEGTPMHLLVAIAAVPLCAMFYTLLAYVVLRIGERLYRRVA